MQVGLTCFPLFQDHSSEHHSETKPHHVQVITPEHADDSPHTLHVYYPNRLAPAQSPFHYVTYILLLALLIHGKLFKSCSSKN